MKEVPIGVMGHSGSFLLRRCRLFEEMAASKDKPFASETVLPHSRFFALESMQKIEVLLSFLRILHRLCREFSVFLSVGRRYTESIVIEDELTLN